MAAHQNGSEANHSQSLKHGLKSRHLTMISIAGGCWWLSLCWLRQYYLQHRPCSFSNLCFRWSTRLVHHAYVRRDGRFKSRRVALFQLMQTVRLVVGQGFQLVGCTGARWRCSWAGKLM